jgi:hypothetical protein
MARKRLSPPQDTYLAPLETKGLSSPFAARPPAPIAQIAGNSAVVAALREVTEELHAARAEGRLVQGLPLAAIEADHLVRDRIADNPEEMQALRASIRARGQQTPVEVVDLGDGRYGLISGWRRLQALTALRGETGDERFATVQALLRRPDSASAAYLAMVEENEIRVGLGHYERARIAARAVEQGVYPSLKAALNHLYQNVSRAKRSKIGSFVTVYQALDGSLRFPAALPERLGLVLAQALEADAGLADRLKAGLAKAAPVTAAEEQAHLVRLLRPAGSGSMSAPPARPADAVEPAPGVWLQVAQGPQGARYILSGPGLDTAFGTRLADWLATQR